MRRSLLVMLALGLLWSADTGTQQRLIIRNGLREELLGCYALYSGNQRVGSSLYNATPSIRLDSLGVRVSGVDTIPGIVRAMVGINAFGQPVASRRRGFGPTWAADSLSDTVRLSFVDGFSGAVFVLSAPAGRSNTLTGRLYQTWDFGPPFETTHGPARAVRERCP